MDTVLIVLGSAFGVMFATMTSLMFVSMRVQHRDSTEIRALIQRSYNDSRDLIEQSNKDLRDLIEQSNKYNRDLIEQSNKYNRDLIEQSNKENRDLIGKLSTEFAEHKRVTEANHRATQEQLSDVRERLGRIEGHLGIGMPPRTDAPRPD